MAVPPIPPSAFAIDPMARAGVAASTGRSRIGAVLGDSISEQNTYVASPLIKRSIGYMNWAQALSGHAFYFDSRYNFGVAGQTSAQIAARVGQVIAANPGFCVVMAGVNDQRGVQTFAQTVANLATIYTALIQANILVVAVPILPINAWAGSVLNTAEHRALERVNTWIRNKAATTPGVVLADATENYIDNAAALGFNIGASTLAATSYTYDGLHPAPRGAFWVGKAIAAAIAPYYPTPLAVGLQSASDLYNAADNPTGSRLNASIALATTGGTVGTGASGVAPAGWTLNRSGGTTGAVAGSFVADTLPNGATINKFQMVATAPGGSALETLTLSANGSVSAGDAVYGSVNVDVSGVGPDSLVAVQLTLRDGTNQPSCMRYQDNFVFPNTSWSGTLVTPMNYVVPGGVTNATLYVDVMINGTVGGAGATVKVSKPKMAMAS